jgi:CheY-like chemotaxis protein
MLSPTTGASDQREAVRQLGVEGIIYKPIKPSMLRAALLECLDTGSSTTGVDVAGEARERADAETGVHHPLQILLVEDNITNQKVALKMLTRLGYRADVVFNGVDALKALRRQQYDLVLMDVQMPEMDGLEATRRIREDFAASEQPQIVAMTAAAMQLDRQKCLQAGMDDFIAKPASISELAAVLKRCHPITSAR